MRAETADNFFYFKMFKFKEYFALLKASKTISKLEEEIAKESSDLVGKPFKHETTLIKVGLIAPAAVYYSLPKREQEQNKEGFESYIKMMAWGLYSGDLEDTLNDGDCKGKEKEYKKLQTHFIKKSKNIAEHYNILEAFEEAENKSKTYQKTEEAYSQKLRNNDYSFIPELLTEDPTLADLTYDRLSVLYDFGLSAAYRIFLDNTSMKSYEKDIRTWATYLSTALQEGLDDVTDLWKDAENCKPTPTIIRGIGAFLENKRLKEIDLLTGDLLKTGFNLTKEQASGYFARIDELRIPKVLRIITKKAKKTIMKNLSSLPEK